MDCEKNKGVLILGASGLIGRYLFNYLFKNTSRKIIGTYASNKIEGLIPFDFSSQRLSELPLEGIKYVVICSAITKLDECRKNPEYSNKVNVEATERILTDSAEKNIFPIFFSSAAVFDGVIGGYKEKDKKNPVNLYGEQKARVEDFIRTNLERYLIVRPGKVFGIKLGEGVLFSEWFSKFRNNEKILCADDEQLSPHYVEDVAKSVEILFNSGAQGIYHINPPEHYSRYEIAKRFFYYLGVEYEKLTRCSIDDFGFAEKQRARNTFLDASKFIKETGFKFTTIEKCFELVKSL